MKYFQNILSIRIHFFFLAKNLSRASQAKNECLVYNIIDGLIDLRKAIFRKKFLKVKIQIK